MRMLIDKINNCKYYDVEQVQILKISKNSLKMFNINACSLNKNFCDLEYLLKSTNINYDIFAISEIRTMKNLEITQNTDLKNYNFEYIPTESTAGGTMLYIADHLAYEPRNELYRHPSINQEEFNKYDLNSLLEKLAMEKKQFFFLVTLTSIY